MGFIIIVILLGIFCFVLSVWFKHEEEVKQKEWDSLSDEEKEIRLDNQQYLIVGQYIGGISNIAIPCNVTILAKRKSEELNVIMDLDFGDGKLNYDIPYSDISSIQIKTETEISKDVTITRLVFMGVFAFGAKKKRVKEENFCIIKYTSSQNIEETMLIKLIPNYNFELFKTINGFIFNYQQKRIDKQ